MLGRRGRFVAVLLITVLWSGRFLAQSQTQPQFRTVIDLVPIEVRVVDRDGAPVTGLEPTDFSLREDGRVQEVKHFRFVSLENSEAESAGRTFMIVLGTGRLNEPTNALQSLIDFVKFKTIPQDRIGVTAYLNAIEPTRDRASVTAFLERYRADHEAVDSRLRADRRNLARTISTRTRAAMSQVFLGGPPVVNLSGSVADHVGRHNDFNYLRASLEYLRSVDGSKHAIIVTERPSPLAKDATRSFWLNLATSARTSLWYIHAGGQNAPEVVRGKIRSGPLLTVIDPWIVAAHRTVATQTGGMAAFFEYADRPLSTLDRTTRSYYELGYYPDRPVAPDRYRSIEVSVLTRPGLQALYRHSYVARSPDVDPNDYRRTVIDARIDFAAAGLLLPSRARLDGEPVPTPRVRLAVGDRKTRSANEWPIVVSFDPRLMTFSASGEIYTSDLELAIYADSQSRDVIGELNRHIDLRLSRSDYARLQREWVQFEVVVETSARPAYVRAVLYDFETDSTGSAQLRLGSTVALHRPN